MTIDTLKTSLSDRYRIERELGAGGMATVYLAEDLKHHRKVAVKVLRPELAAVIGEERFLSEIRTTANLQHPHILPLFDSGAAGSFLFYVMPFIDGESLRDRLTRETQLPVADAVRIATEVASALDYAHRHGVIHRDIKPENVLLHDGRAQVADFGIALAASKAGGTRMTETGMSLGTPTYMSPEQAMGEREITARSDVYALGAMTYEMLIGEPPFTGPTAQAIVARVMTEVPRSLRTQRPTVPLDVEEAVLTALQKLPADRFGSAAEFGKALVGESVTARRIVRGAEAGSSPRLGSRAGVGIMLAVTITAALAGAWFGRRGNSVDDGLQLARQLTFEGNVTAAAITADGKSLAYVTDDCLGQATSCRVTLRVRDVDGTQSVAIARSWRAIARLKWSPDGSRLALIGSPDSSATAVYLIDKLGGSLQPLRIFASAMAFTRDSRFITAAVGLTAQSLQRFDIATLARADSIALPHEWAVRDLDYAPDGRRIVATVATARVVPGLLALLGANGGVIDSLTEWGAARDPIRWAPDGSAVYTFEFSPGVADNLIRIPIRGNHIDTLARSIALGQVNGGAFGIFDVSSTGRFAIIATQQSYQAMLHTGPADQPWRTISHRTGFIAPWGISPAGNAVLAAATDNLGDNVTLFPFDSAIPSRALTAMRGVHQFPEWSPDGKRVALYSFVSNRTTLALIDASGGAERPIVSGEFIPFVWVSNDALLLLSAESVRIVDTSGKVRSRFAVPSRFAPSGWPVIDPLYGRIAYPSRAAGGEVIVDLHQQAFNLAIPRPTPLQPVAWSHDGLALFATGWEAALGIAGRQVRRVFRVPLSGGPPTVVLDLPPFCGDVIVDTDARHVVCAILRSAPEVWLADKAGRSGW